jgi:aminopeptidase N
MIKRILSVALLSLFMSGCTHQVLVDSKEQSPQARQAKDWLSDTHAKLRKKQVSNVTYALDFDITKNDKFSGVTTIIFDSHLLSDDLTIDFSHGEVQKVWVNDIAVDFNYNDYFITVPKSSLRLGKMAVKIKYSHLYSDNGSGLYRYLDKSDNNSYLYTHFEPYNANKLFPSFDQPNLRATYTVNVVAPVKWSVITSVRESTVEEKGDVKVWHFPESDNFSTYVFPLHAGPYHVWHDQFEDIPLRLFARQSLAQYVDSDTWFDVTKKGMAYFNHYFDYSYPFGKYDQLIVPDFNISGMENVAAVTYTEDRIVRGQSTQAHTERTASLLLHELSHMWFGDLITIDWWSNLWLKESFATYMSNLAMSETKLSDNAWNVFYSRVKQSAYQADSKVTTHAIQTSVKDTKSGIASFDSITYSKGASVLNQLTHYLGADTFREGIRQYFKKYDYQATKLPDFMDTLGKVANLDVDKWTQDWLYLAGTNRIRADFTCQNGKVSQFSLVQSYPKDHPYLREHSLNIGLYTLKDEFKVVKTQAVKVSGETTQVPALIGTQCPDMVYPNHQDWGFVKVILDDKTRDNVISAIPLIKDAMLRAMFYQSLWDLVGDQHISLTSYIDSVVTIIDKEKDPKVLELVMDHLQFSRAYLNMFDLPQYTAKQQYLLKIEDFLVAGFKVQAPGSDHQKVWFNHMLMASQSDKSNQALEKLLHGTVQYDGLIIDQDKRWQIIKHLAGFNYPQLDSLLAKEKAADPSYQGELATIAIEARRPTLAAKKYWIAEFEKTKDRQTAKKQKIAMYNLFPSYQMDLLAPLAERLIADLVAFDVDRDQKLVGSMVYSVMPTLCRDQSVVKLKRVIDDNPQLGLIAMKGLREMHQADAKCVAISKVQ